MPLINRRRASQPQTASRDLTTFVTHPTSSLVKDYRTLIIIRYNNITITKEPSYFMQSSVQLSQFLIRSSFPHFLRTLVRRNKDPLGYKFHRITLALNTTRVTIKDLEPQIEGTYPIWSSVVEDNIFVTFIPVEPLISASFPVSHWSEFRSTP